MVNGVNGTAVNASPTAQDIKVKQQIAGSTADFGGACYHSGITIGGEGKYSAGLPTATVVGSANLLDKAGLLTARVGLSTTVENQATGSNKAAATMMGGVNFQPQAIFTDKRGHNQFQNANRTDDGMYLNLGVGVLEYTPTQGKSAATLDGYTGLKYIGGQGDYAAEAGVRMNKFIPGGHEYQATATGTIYKTNSSSILDRMGGRDKCHPAFAESTCDIYGKAGVTYNPTNNKTIPSFTVGINF